MHPVISEEAVKAKAKALRKALAAKGVQLNHQACIEVMAYVEGEKNWAALNAKQNRASVQAPAAKKVVLGFSETKNASVFDYTFDVSFYNPEGNRIHQDLYLTLDDARHAQAEWRMQGSGWGAELLEFKWVNGVAEYPEKTDSYDFRHPVEFRRQDGTEFIDRFETEAEARREVKRWNSLADSSITAKYLGEEPVFKGQRFVRKPLPPKPDGPGHKPPYDWRPNYTPWSKGGWYVNNVRYPNGSVGCVSNNYPDKKWRIVCDKRGNSLNEPGDFTFTTRDEAARAEYALAKAAFAAESLQ